MLDRKRPRVSILIKALNEEGRIAAAIESALASLEGMDGEVILADSLSADRTVEIAKRYPIKIVSLTRPEDRSCGVGGQLGYQYSTGDYICLIDGDMKLYPGFLAAALRRLESDPTLAGVGGIIVEREAYSLEYVKRAGRDDPDRRPGFVRRLDCGGVYRRSAIESIGYFTDRNLHGGEEFDLGARLHAYGWRLARIDHPAIDHFGHQGSAYLLLLRRVLSRVALGAGEGLRAAIGREHFWFVLRHQGRAFALWLTVYAWWFGLATTPFVAGTPLVMSEELTGLILLPVAIMILRSGSVSMGIYSVVAWNINALCFLPGLLRPRVDPRRWVESSEINLGQDLAIELANAS
jgi:glycosyltransferase involved in cell wall biosynthesis